MFLRERFFSRVSAEKNCLVFFGVFWCSLLFLGDVFVFFGVFFRFSRISAKKNVFFGAGMSKTGNSRSVPEPPPSQ